jgi:hypothetical protein
LFLTLKEVTVVNGQKSYRFPERAIGSALKTLMYGTDANQVWEIPRVQLSRSQDSVFSGNPDSFYMVGDSLELNPTPNGGGVLQMWYYLRPSEIVPTSEVATITNIAGTTLTVDTDLSGVLSTSTKADIYSVVTPSIFKSTDITVNSVGASTIVVPEADVSVDGVLQIEVNDYIALEQTCNVPLIPAEYHPVLAQAVACRLLEALGDLNKLQTGMAKLGEMRSQAMKLIMNRVETAVEFFNNPYGIGNQTGRYSKRAALR